MKYPRFENRIPNHPQIIWLLLLHSSESEYSAIADMAAAEGDKSLEEAIAMSLQKNTKLASDQPGGAPTAGSSDSGEVSLKITCVPFPP